MWMPGDGEPKDEMRQFYEITIKPAIENLGFEAYRVDDDAEVERIDVDTMTAIDEAAFVVADLTSEGSGMPRANVYFEAGYAYGKKPVVWMCRSDQAGNTPFDIRQMQQIRWDPSKLTEGRINLENKLRAVLNDRVRTRSENEIAGFIRLKLKELRQMRDLREVGGRNAEPPMSIDAATARFLFFKDLVSDIELRAKYKPGAVSEQERYEILDIVRGWKTMIRMFERAEEKENKGIYRPDNWEFYKEVVIRPLQEIGWWGID